MGDATGPTYQQLWLERQFDNIDQELARLALLCRVDLSEESSVHRVIKGDASVCKLDNPVAFRRMRDMLMLHYIARERATQAVGATETQEIIDIVVSRIKDNLRRLGHGG